MKKGLFAFHFSKPLKFVLDLPKWEFSTGKKHFSSGKNREKWLCPLRKKILLRLCFLVVFVCFFVYLFVFCFCFFCFVCLFVFLCQNCPCNQMNFWLNWMKCKFTTCLHHTSCRVKLTPRHVRVNTLILTPSQYSVNICGCGALLKLGWC